MSRPVIGPLTDRDLVDLKTWLEVWFRGRNEKGADGWRFNVDNEGGWGFVRSNDSTDIDYGEWGLVFADTSGEGILLVGQDSIANTAEGQIWVTDTQIKFFLTPSGATASLGPDGTFSCVLDGGGP